MGMKLMPKKKICISRQTLWIFIMLFFFVILLMPGIPYILGLLMVLLGFGLSVIFCPDVALLSIAFISSFNGFIRWKDPESMLLGGFQTEITLLLLFLYFIRFIFISRKTGYIKKGDSENIIGPFKLYYLLVITLSLFILWVIIISLLYWNNIIEFVLILREYVLALTLFPVIVSVLRKRVGLSQAIFFAFVSGAAFIAFIDILRYFTGVSLHIPRFVGSENGIFIPRVVLGVPLPRLKSILGLGSAGGAGIYYSALSICAVACAYLFKLKRKYNVFLLVCSFVLIIAAILTVSFSVILALIFAAIFILFILNIGTNKKIAVLCLLVIPVALYAYYGEIITPAEDASMSLAEYSSTWEGNILNTISNQNEGLNNLLFGNGIGLRSGVLFNSNRGETDLSLRDISVDKGLFIIMFQVGIIGFILMIIVTTLALFKCFNALKSNDWRLRADLIPAGIIISAFIVYPHGVFFTERLFSTIFILVLAIVTSAKKNNFKGIKVNELRNQE